MKRPHDKIKYYALNQSPLYKLTTKRKLAALFNISTQELLSLASREDNYRVFQINRSSGKPRTVEVPKPHLERVHHRLFFLLSRITPPKFLHSGVKNRSYITNAEAHVGANRLVKLDINKFFPSTKAWHVSEFFVVYMKCTPDVAGILTALCTCGGHVPTGSCVSQIIAYYAHMGMFKQIYDLANELGVNMTCYVDDIAFSGKNANKALLSSASKIMMARGLVCHKERVYRGDQPKIVTGVVVTADNIKLPNRRHLQIFTEYQQLQHAAEESDVEKRLEILLGRVNAAAELDSIYRPRAKRLQHNLTRIRNQKITA